MVGEVHNNLDLVEDALARYEQPLVRFALRIVLDEELARDVVQDTFFKLCKADRSKVEGHVTAWLFTVCRNRAFDVKKKEGRMGRLKDAGVVADGNAGPQERAAQNELLGLVVETLGTLSEQEREAFRLKFQDHLSYREISEVMGKSLGTVSKLITTSLCAVRDRLRSAAGEPEEVTT
jgi:RNA polymerase sigma factor (sigma-70 family)